MELADVLESDDKLDSSIQLKGRQRQTYALVV